MAQETKPRTDKWDYIKLKSFCMLKETITKVQKHPTEENLYKGLISRIYKKLKKGNTKRIIQLTNELNNYT
jgi:hypothetical protein